MQSRKIPIYFGVSSHYYNPNNKSYTLQGSLIRNSHKRLKIGARSLLRIEVNENRLNIEPRRGQAWKITGNYDTSENSRNNKLQTLITFTDDNDLSIRMVESACIEEFIKFIEMDKENFKGIGVDFAQKVFDEFDTEVFSLLKDGSEEAVSKVAAITTSAKSKILFEGYKSYGTLKYAEWFSRIGLPPHVQYKLYKYFEEDVVDIITADPFVLCAFGLSFKEVDMIAMNGFNMSVMDERRLTAAVGEVMHNHCNEGGHTMIDLNQHFNDVVEVLDGDEELAGEATFLAHQSQRLYYCHQTKTLHHSGYFLMESVVAKWIINRVELAREEIDWDYSQLHSNTIRSLPFKANYEQQEAIWESLHRPILIVTGSAGTGKTTVTKAILDAHSELGYQTRCVALAGRAARKLQESAGYSATTIQRLLMEGEELYQCQKLLVVIDESSMVDIASMYKILVKIPEHAKLLILGDEEQLAPIGAGLVLHELIDEEITKAYNIIQHVHLVETMRQKVETGIPDYANAVRNNEMPKELTTGNIQFIETPRANMVDEAINAYRESKLDAQIIVPTLKYADAINMRCQQEFNGGSPKLLLQNSYGKYEDTGFRLLDRVLFTKNFEKKGKDGFSVENGTLGTMKQIYPKDTKFKDTIAIVETDEGRLIEIDRELLFTMDLSYAITLHKSQGSDFEHAIALMTKSRVVDKSWVYTAITRSRTSLNLIGSSTAMANAIAAGSLFKQRQVFLKELILKEFNGAISKDKSLMPSDA